MQHHVVRYLTFSVIASFSTKAEALEYINAHFYDEYEGYEVGYIGGDVECLSSIW